MITFVKANGGGRAVWAFKEKNFTILTSNDVVTLAMITSII